MLIPPTIPISKAAGVGTELHPAVIETNPAIEPLIKVSASTTPLRCQPTIPAPSIPAAPERTVCTIISGISLLKAKVLPPLKPNQPTHNSITPSTEKGKFEP